MIGRRVASRPVRPRGAFLFLVVALALTLGGIITKQVEPVLWAFFPTGVGLALWRSGRHQPFSARFTVEAIEVEEPAGVGVIPYDRLRRVWAGEHSPMPETFRKKSCPILIQHEQGLLRIPPNLDEGVRSDEVYKFLASRLADGPRRTVNPVLADYVRRQDARHGPEQVWTYQAETIPKTPGRYPRLRAFCLGLILASLAWCVHGFAKVNQDGWNNSEAIPWVVAGLFAGLTGLIFFAASFARVQSGQLGRNWKASSLVISPEGLAMSQGDLQGEITWPEVREIRHAPKTKSFTADYRPAHLGIVLKLAGADVLIANIYDRPLHVIHRRLLAASGRSLDQHPKSTEAPLPNPSSDR